MIIFYNYNNIKAAALSNALNFVNIIMRDVPCAASKLPQMFLVVMVTVTAVTALLQATHWGSA